MKKPLVIGYGNPLRQDDGIAWHAADLLEFTLPTGSAKICRKHQLTPELVDAISDASIVIFLDASVAVPLSSVSCEPVQPETRSAFWHSMTPGQLLSLIDVPVPAYLVSGGVRHMGWSDRLTFASQKTATEMAERARSLLTQFTRFAGR